MVLDGEIAVPDDRGVTHLDALSEAISDRRAERLAYFAFDLLHLDGHDLRRCPIEDRKMLLRDILGVADASGSSTSTTCAGSVASCLKPCNRSALRRSCRAMRQPLSRRREPGLVENEMS